MSCKQIDESSMGWVLGLQTRAHNQRIPLSATLELTHRCNLRCRHCYIGEQEFHSKCAPKERSTEEVKASIREWVDAGCLYLLITGGDPMMRRDFCEIYQYACEQGLIVTVFCDGILVTDAVVEMFKEFPPRRVEISIYGATASTYETVTRVQGSHAAAWVGIHRLLDEGIRLFLKTILLSLNQHELDAMEQQAKALGLHFRYDSAVFPCLHEGNDAVVDLRADPATVVALDFANESRRQGWLAKLDAPSGALKTDLLYPCGAGKSGFFVDPYGDISPCLLTTQFAETPGERSFQQVWEQSLGRIGRLKREGSGGMLWGEQRAACQHCPAMNQLETGNEEIDSAYFAEIAQLRYEAMQNLKGSDTKS